MVSKDMNQFLDPLLMIALGLNFFALGASRVRAVVYAVAWQGVILGFLPLLTDPEVDLRLVLLVAATVTLKGFIIPTLLLKAVREANIRHEIRPLVGFIFCLLLGAVGTALAMVFARYFPLDQQHSTTLIVPASLSTVLTGFLMLTTRRRPINQVLGYLVLENGIFIFGLLILEAVPFLVEIGVLLDLFTGVFVMGIIIHHISREFSSASTEYLSELKE
jgi:hydrogenase-4 component E